MRAVQHLRTFARFLIGVYRGFMRHQGLDIAKSLTYTSLFAVVPLLTLLLMLFSTFQTFSGIGDRIESLLLDQLLPNTGHELHVYLQGFAEQGRKLTWVGAAMLAVTAILMLREIESSFNRIWGVEEMPKGWGRTLLFWSVMSLGPLLLGLGLVISSYLRSLSLFAKFTELSGAVGARSAALELFPTILTVGAFTLLYMVVPNCRVRMRDALIGAVAVTLALKGVQWAFTLSITTASYQLLYGTFAAVPIGLFWLYVCWVVILAGANLVHFLPQYGRVVQVERRR